MYYEKILIENEHEEAVASAEPELYVADSTLGKASSTLNGNTHPDADTDNLDCGANDGDTVCLPFWLVYIYFWNCKHLLILRLL